LQLFEMPSEDLLPPSPVPPSPAPADSGCPASTRDDFQCMVEVIAEKFYLHYAVLLSENGDSTLDLMAEAETTNGWIAFGFSPGSGMVGSTVVLASATIDGGVFWLNSKSVEGVQPTDVVDPFDADSIEYESSDGWSTIRVRTVPNSVDIESDASLLAAYHKQTSDLAQHEPSDRQAFIVNFESGDVQASDDSIKGDHEAHGILMGIAWAFLIPLGAFVAAFGKPRKKKIKGDPSVVQEKTSSLWFIAHICLQLVGLVLTIPGTIIAFVNFDTRSDLAHRQIGIAVIAIGFFQPVNAAFKPRPEAKLRSVWTFIHVWVGRGVVVLGIVNVYLGMNRYDDIYHDPAVSKGNGVFYVLVIVFQVLLATAAIILLIIRVGLKPRRHHEKEIEIPAASNSDEKIEGQDS